MFKLRNVHEGLAASPAPDRRLLLVLDDVLVEIRNIFEVFATCSTLEQELLLCEPSVRLDAWSLLGFLFLPRPVIVRGAKGFELSEEVVFIESLFFGTSGCLRFLFTSGTVEIPFFGTANQILEPFFEVFFHPYRYLVIVECTGLIRVEVA